MIPPPKKNYLINGKFVYNNLVFKINIIIVHNISKKKKKERSFLF